MEANPLLPKSKAKTAYGLLREVQKLALEEPKRMKMSITLAQKGTETWFDVPEYPVEYPACQTVGCIAGWVTVLKPTGKPGVIDDAQAVLGLTDGQMEKLFMPPALCRQPGQTPAHARAVSRHIDRFIAKHGSQLKRKKV